jgi:hypothetical protein
MVVSNIERVQAERTAIAKREEEARKRSEAEARKQHEADDAALLKKRIAMYEWLMDNLKECEARLAVVDTQIENLGDPLPTPERMKTFQNFRTFTYGDTVTNEQLFDYWMNQMGNYVNVPDHEGKYGTYQKLPNGFTQEHIRRIEAYRLLLHNRKNASGALGDARARIKTIEEQEPALAILKTVSK